MQTPHQTVSVQALRNARFVERIAHGRTKNSIHSHDVDARIGAVAEPIAADPRRPADLPGTPGESSMIVYCGDDEQVSQGFMLALRAMGIRDESFQKEGVGQPWGWANPEGEQ